jgi:cytochrome c
MNVLRFQQQNAEGDNMLTKINVIHLVVWGAFLLIGFNAKADEGKEIFDSLRCGLCHKLDTGKTTPSLNEIASSYKGKEGQLLIYLKGEAGPIVNPGKKETMKLQIEKTKELKEEERKALADFILNP